ncbi:MAG: hypothetical protein WCA63_13575, partial [Gallionella sp.]
MNIKLGILATLTIAAISMAAFQSVAMADPSEHSDQWQMKSGEMHNHIHAKLDKLAGRLEIKASQQATWEAYAKSVEMLAEGHAKKPNEDADAATISRYRADKAAEFAKKLATIADATAKLQAVLTEDQKTIFNQALRRFSHRHHGHMHRGWGHENHEQGHGGWDKHGNRDGESSKD